MTWDVSGAMMELENFPPNDKINWSAMARNMKFHKKMLGRY